MVIVAPIIAIILLIFVADYFFYSPKIKPVDREETNITKKVDLPKGKIKTH